MQIHNFRLGVGPGISAGSGPQIPAPAPRRSPSTPPTPAQPYNPVISSANALSQRVEDSAPVRAGRWVTGLPGRIVDSLSNWWNGYRNRLAENFQPRLPEPPSSINKGTHPGISDGESVRRPIPIGGIGGAIGGGPRGAAPHQFP